MTFQQQRVKCVKWGCRIAARREAGDASSLQAPKADLGRADGGYKEIHFNSAE